jgi:hypothetical protein
MFMDQRRFPLPKADGRTRGLTVISPVAELALRTYVGRCSAPLAAAVDERRILNGLVRSPGPGWFSADFKEQNRIRRDLQRTYYEADSTRAVAFLDFVASSQAAATTGSARSSTSSVHLSAHRAC